VLCTTANDAAEMTQWVKSGHGDNSPGRPLYPQKRALAERYEKPVENQVTAQSKPTLF
jgi:hypothetical protein